MNTGDEALALLVLEEALMGSRGCQPLCKALPLPRAGAELWCSLWGTGDDGAGLGERSFSPLCIARYLPVDPSSCWELL